MQKTLILAAVALTLSVQGSAAQFAPRMEAPSVLAFERLQPGESANGGSWNSHVVVLSGDISLRETLRLGFDLPAARIGERTSCDWVLLDPPPSNFTCEQPVVSHLFLGNPNLALTLGSVWMPVSVTFSHRPSLLSYNPGPPARQWTAGEAIERARAADFGDRGYAFVPGLSVTGIEFEVNDEGGIGHGAAATAGVRLLRYGMDPPPSADGASELEWVGTFRGWLRFDELRLMGSVRYQAIEIGSGLESTQWAEMGFLAEYELGRYSPVLSIRVPLRSDYRGVAAPPFGLALGVRAAVSAVY